MITINKVVGAKPARAKGVLLSSASKATNINPQTMRHRVLPMLAPMVFSKMWRRKRRAKAIEKFHGVGFVGIV